LIAVVRVRGFGLSHNKVKRAVGLFIGFVFAIASAPCGFLYLKQRIHDLKRKKKNKKDPYFLGSSRYLVFLSPLLYFRI